VCKQLAQGCYPMEQWRDPGFEPRSLITRPSDESAHARYCHSPRLHRPESGSAMCDFTEVEQVR